MNVPVDFSRARWRKSTRSSGSGSDCVEIAALDDVIAVRDSKAPDGPKLLVARKAWRELCSRAAKGEFDL